MSPLRFRSRASCCEHEINASCAFCTSALLYCPRQPPWPRLLTGHLVIDDGHADCIVASGYITISHVSFLSYAGSSDIEKRGRSERQVAFHDVVRQVILGARHCDAPFVHHDEAI